MTLRSANSALPSPRLKNCIPKLVRSEGCSAIRQAYRNGEVLQSQGAERVFVRGPFESGYIEMWVNRATKTIESAWPKL